MIRVAAALTCILLLTSRPAAAMVGGAQPTSDGAGRAVVMLTGSHGTFCSGVALTPDLVLTAAHCVLPGADYKLIDFDAGRQPVLKDIANIARHPEFDVNAVLRHRVTADVALLKLAAPMKVVPAPLGPAGAAVAVSDRFVVAGYGVAVRGDGKRAAARCAPLPLSPPANRARFRSGSPIRLPKANAAASAPAPAIPVRRSIARSAGRSRSSAW